MNDAFAFLGIIPASFSLGYCLVDLFIETEVEISLANRFLFIRRESPNGNEYCSLNANPICSVHIFFCKFVLKPIRNAFWNFDSIVTVESVASSLVGKLTKSYTNSSETTEASSTKYQHSTYNIVVKTKLIHKARQQLEN